MPMHCIFISKFHKTGHLYFVWSNILPLQTNLSKTSDHYNTHPIHTVKQRLII